jgi:hypothetical protein
LIVIFKRSFVQSQVKAAQQHRADGPRGLSSIDIHFQPESALPNEMESDDGLQDAEPEPSQVSGCNRLVIDTVLTIKDSDVDAPHETDDEASIERDHPTPARNTVGGKTLPGKPIARKTVGGKTLPGNTVARKSVAGKTLPGKTRVCRQRGSKQTEEFVKTPMATKPVPLQGKVKKWRRGSKSVYYCLLLIF